MSHCLFYSNMLNRLYCTFYQRMISLFDVFFLFLIILFSLLFSLILVIPFVIEEFAQRDSFMRFILNPTENLKDMREDWILWLEDDELRNVIGNDELMIRIGKYCKDVYDNVSKEIKRRIWKVITTNNIESQI